MTNTHLFRVGDTVELRLDVLEKEGSDPGSLIDWYLYSGRSDCFVITKIDESYPEAPYLLDKFFCETYFSEASEPERMHPSDWYKGTNQPKETKWK